MAKKAKPKVEPPCLKPGRILNSSEMKSTAFYRSKAKDPKAALEKLVADFAATPGTVKVETETLHASDPRRKLVKCRFQIHGVDYCAARPVVRAPLGKCRDSFLVRQTQRAIFHHLKICLQLAYLGWDDEEAMAPFLVKSAPTKPVPPVPAPTSTKWRKRAKPNT